MNNNRSSSNNNNNISSSGKRNLSSDDKIELAPVNKKSLTIAKHYFAKFELVRSRENGLGEMCIIGIDDDDDDDGDDDDELQEHIDEKDNNNNKSNNNIDTNDNIEEEVGAADDDDLKQSIKEMNQEQADSLRYIILTQRRVDLLDEKEKIVLSEQYDQDYLMFNSDFSTHIIKIIEEESNKYNKINNLKLRFDHLFTFTRTLSNYDYWIEDNENILGLKKSIGILAKVWLKILTNNSLKLGIDIEYTHPGIVTMLKQFQNKMHSIDIEFKFGF
jgi:hypothetical protein